MRGELKRTGQEIDSTHGTGSGTLPTDLLCGQKKGAYGRLSRPHCLIILFDSYLLQFLCLVTVPVWRIFNASQRQATDINWR